MEELEKQRAVKLVEQLHDAEGVVADAAEDKLYVVSYPKKEVRPLRSFMKADLEAAIHLKLLASADIITINGKECQVYMKTLASDKAL